MFCGMCGTALSPGRFTEPESAVKQAATTWEPVRAEVADERPAEAKRFQYVEEPVEARCQPSASTPASPERPARPSEKWWVEDGEGETTVGGPSFLGLSSSDAKGSGGYSYLLEEEKQSHAGRWVFLLVLLALGGVVYAKWQPIRDYVLTTAIAHSRPQITPPQKPTNDPVAAPGTSAPTTTLATSDAPSQPTITTENPPQATTTAPKDNAASPKQEAAQPASKDAEAKQPPAQPEETAKSTPAGKRRRAIRRPSGRNRKP